MKACRNPEVCKHLFAYAANKLDADMSERVRQVVVECESCQMLLQGYQNVLESLAVYQSPLGMKVSFPASPFPAAKPAEVPLAEETERGPSLSTPVSPTSVIPLPAEERQVRQLRQLPSRVPQPSTPVFRPWGLIRLLSPDHYNAIFHVLSGGFILGVVVLSVVMFQQLRTPVGLSSREMAPVTLSEITIGAWQDSQPVKMILPAGLRYTSGVRVTVTDLAHRPLILQVVKQPMVEVPIVQAGSYQVLLESLEEQKSVTFRVTFEGTSNE